MAKKVFCYYYYYFFFVASYGKTQMNFLVNPIYSMGLFCVGQQEGSYKPESGHSLPSATLIRSEMKLEVRAVRNFLTPC